MVTRFPPIGFGLPKLEARNFVSEVPFWPSNNALHLPTFAVSLFGGSQTRTGANGKRGLKSFPRWLSPMCEQWQQTVKSSSITKTKPYKPTRSTGGGGAFLCAKPLTKGNPGNGWELSGCAVGKMKSVDCNNAAAAAAT